MDVSPLDSACLSCSSRQRQTSRLSCRGASLIELMVTIVIAAILASYAIPSLGGFTKRQQQITAINALLSSLYLARSEAIKRNGDVMLCKSSNGLQCVRSGEWEQGWIMFADGNGNRLRDSTETLIAKHDPLAGVNIYYRAFGSNHYLVYTRNGLTYTNGTFTICALHDDVTPRAIILFKTGRPRRSDTSSSGTALQCPP